MVGARDQAGGGIGGARLAGWARQYAGCGAVRGGAGTWTLAPAQCSALGGLVARHRERPRAAPPARPAGHRPTRLEREHGSQPLVLEELPQPPVVLAQQVGHVQLWQEGQQVLRGAKGAARTACKATHTNNGRPVPGRPASANSDHALACACRWAYGLQAGEQPPAAARRPTFSP